MLEIGATEHFLKWIYAVYMPTLHTVLGPHAYMFQRYGVSPYDDVDAAVEKLQLRAPHLARLLKEVAYKALP